MYYTLAVTIPGKVAHVRLEWARSYAKSMGTYVMDDNFEIIEDYRQ
jgi:hypothetical protein